MSRYIGGSVGSLDDEFAFFESKLTRPKKYFWKFILILGLSSNPAWPRSSCPCPAQTEKHNDADDADDADDSNDADTAQKLNSHNGRPSPSSASER